MWNWVRKSWIWFNTYPNTEKFDQIIECFCALCLYRIFFFKLILPFFRIEMKNELQPNRHTFWRIFPCEKALCWLCDTEKKQLKTPWIYIFRSSLLEQIVVSQLLPQKYWCCMRLQILLSDSQAARRQMFHFPHFRDGSPTCFLFLCEYFHFEGSGPLISASIKWLSDAITR